MKNLKSTLIPATLALALVMGAVGAQAQTYSNFNENMFSAGNPASYNQTTVSGDIHTTTNVTPGDILKVKTQTGTETLLGVSATTTTVVSTEGGITYVMKSPYNQSVEGRYKATGLLLSGIAGIPPAPVFEMSDKGKIKIGGVITAIGGGTMQISTLNGIWNVKAEDMAAAAENIKVGDYIILGGELDTTAMFTVKIK